MKYLTLFIATWCGPCKELKSWMEDKGLGINIRQVDIDLDPLFASSHSVKRVPTLLVRKENEIAFQLLEGREEMKPYLEHFSGCIK